MGKKKRVNCGNARERIFYGDKDRDRFLQYLAIGAERFSIVITIIGAFDDPTLYS